jgi:hypothetical protein
MRVISPKQTERLEWKDRMAGIITFLAILAFVVLEVFLGILLWSTNTSMTEIEWGRFIYLLTGVETITFAGIGWLFGKEVHREQAQAAERQAEGAMQQVTEAMKQNGDIMSGAMQQVTETRKETLEIVHQAMGALTQPSTQLATYHSFIHMATSENTRYNFTDIDSPYTNSKPDAIVIVTQNWNPGGVGGTYDEHPIGVWYHNGKWSIYNQDKNPDAKQKKPMPIGAAFNVLVVDR